MMLDFYYHDKFSKETAKLKRRFVNIEKGIKSFEKLCETQFHPTSPEQIIAPAKLHHISSNTIYSMWKVELIIPNSGLKPNQFPRLWFAVKGTDIVLLAIASHIDNYDDNKMTKVAMERVDDFF